MKKGVYSIFDNKACVFNSPFTAHTDAEAERTLSDGIKNMDSVLGHNPQDFALFRIGDFDCISGQLSGLPSPIHIAHGSQFLPRTSVISKVAEVD